MKLTICIKPHLTKKSFFSLHKLFKKICILDYHQKKIPFLLKLVWIQTNTYFFSVFTSLYNYVILRDFPLKPDLKNPPPQKKTPYSALMYFLWWKLRLNFSSADLLVLWEKSHLLFWQPSNQQELTSIKKHYVNEEKIDLIRYVCHHKLDE